MKKNSPSKTFKNSLRVNIKGAFKKGVRMEKMSMSHEDYLEAMVMLGANPEHPVRAVDVAEKMGVSKASVNKAVAVLKGKHLLDQPYYGDITLTQDGWEYGQKVLDRHEALTRFLNKGIGIDAEVAEAEACQMEHAISDESFEKWLEFINKLDLDK
jgi:Mn-dependent DtxR family transcriptional regulator